MSQSEKPTASSDSTLELPPGPTSLPATRGPNDHLRTIAVRCVHTQPKNTCRWHSHPFHELCLTTEGATTTGIKGVKTPTGNLNLAWYHPGEEHAYWNSESQRPRFWVLHFSLDEHARSILPSLQPNAKRRNFHTLTTAQAERFKWVFMRISGEHASDEIDAPLAESAWLRLLLVDVDRWMRGAFAPSTTPTAARGEVLRMWQIIQENAGRPNEVSSRLRAMPSYHSLRQEFARVFGCSPGRMAMRTRMQVAKNLLIETPLSIKQVSEQIGYLRQHEFTRAFRRETGRSPTEWKQSPD
ncbi:AraC family transcriptional regulator [Nibricoccus sp. IMCC34717]|uniref:AraC family transcriptional regulator n=1 Tax=Nibricoccus sp. IMCC34717 TaxID=3034021 RepID=UPI0038503015